MIERERTYILSKLPGNLHEYSMKDIVDLYIPLRCGMAQLRARKKGSHYELTKKFPVQEGNTATQHEYTIAIDEDEFDYLFSYLPQVIKKKRYTYVSTSGEGSVTYDIDIFEGRFSGLVMADIEFEDEATMASFVAPDFLGKEVTHDTRFAGGVLALMGDEDVKKFLKGIGV